MLSKVLLPQPDGPISDTTSPSAIARLTPSTATTKPWCGFAKRLVTLRNSSLGWTSASPASDGACCRRCRPRSPIRRTWSGSAGSRAASSSRSARPHRRSTRPVHGRALEVPEQCRRDRMATRPELGSSRTAPSAGRRRSPRGGRAQWKATWFRPRLASGVCSRKRSWWPPRAEQRRKWPRPG